MLLFITGIGIYIMVSESKTPQTAIPEDAVYTPDEIVVQFVDGYIPAPAGENKEWDQLYTKLQKLGVQDYKKVFDSNDPDLTRFYTLTLTQGADVEKIRKELYELDEIESSEPDYILYTQATANDSEYSAMWNLHTIDIESAWNVTKGSNSVTVGVVDTGIDYNHPDFAGRAIIKGKDVSTCDSSINELKSSGGRCSKPKQPDNDPMDTNGHGTHVAGTIGAATNNSLGVAGINWDVTLVAVKVLGAGGAGGLSEIAEGLRDAADRGVDVINMSLGGIGTCSQGSMIHAAVEYAKSRGVTIVAAAGNDNNDATSFVPAACPGVITVGATGPNDERAAYSNFGSRVDLAAPGGNKGAAQCRQSNCINSTWIGGKYSSIQGTSMAAPHVSGVAALMLAQNSALTPDDIKRCLIESGDSITTDRPIGGKRLNAYNALNGCIASENNTSVTPEVTVTVTPEELPAQVPVEYYIRGLAYDDNNKNLTRDSGENVVSGVALTLSGKTSRTAVTGSDGTYSFMSLQPGSYLLTASVNNRDVMEYRFLLDLNSSSFDIPIPIPPQMPDDKVTPPVRSDRRTPITGSPTPTPRPLFTCRERTTTREVNNNLIQLKYLDCTPK